MQTKSSAALAWLLLFWISAALGQVHQGGIFLDSTHMGYLGTGQRHLFAFSVPSAQKVTVELFGIDPNPFDPALVLQDAAGKQIESNDNGCGYPNARISAFLDPGSYRILAHDSSGKNAGSYRLILLSAEGPFGVGETRISPGQNVSGSLNPGQRAVYILEVPFEQRITIEMSRDPDSRIDPYLALEDPWGRRLAGDDDSAGAPNARLSQSLGQGVYRIIARGYGKEGGGFALSVSGVGSRKDEIPTAIGRTEEGRIEAGQGPTYILTLAEQQSVTIEMLRADVSQLDPVLALQDASGHQLAIDDDGAGYPNARIVRLLQPGTYRILPREFRNNDSGSFTLHVRGSSIEVSRISIGRSVEGRIADGRAQPYLLTLTSGKNVAIEMVRADESRMDPLLVLQDASGNEIARDDDGGGYPNARIARYLPAGSYHIFAGDFGNDDTGNFRLSVR